MLIDPAEPGPRSCGSFFVNPVVSADVASEIKERFASENLPLYPQSSGSVKLAAAWLIEKSGFQRGYQAGTVGLSGKHSLALVAHADATARDVVLLARQIQKSVKKQFGVELIPEPVFWGFSRMNAGLPNVAFE
jgi:UDP-N-acetylmuramate dehydrogenase